MILVGKIKRDQFYGKWENWVQLNRTTAKLADCAIGRLSAVSKILLVERTPLTHLDYVIIIKSEQT